MSDKRARLEPPDISEKGGLKGGQPQRSDERLFIQLMAFTGCESTGDVIRDLQAAPFESVLYEDLNDPRGVALLTLSRDPNTFIDRVRPALKSGALAALTLRPDLTMFGRTYSLGYEPDLPSVLFDRPRRTVLNPAWPWAVWYPLRRNGAFEQLEDREKGGILREHATIGQAYGAQNLAHDVRLACHGLDQNDNEFVIGLMGEQLHPLSHVVQTMRRTRQTSQYIAQMGPFFVGHRAWQSVTP